MCGIKYGIRISEGEFNKQCWQTPIINTALYEVNEQKKKQALKDAEESWETPEYQESLKRSHEQFRKNFY